MILSSPPDGALIHARLVVSGLNRDYLDGKATREGHQGRSLVVQLVCFGSLS